MLRQLAGVDQEKVAHRMVLITIQQAARDAREAWESFAANPQASAETRESAGKEVAAATPKSLGKKRPAKQHK